MEKSKKHKKKSQKSAKVAALSARNSSLLQSEPTEDMKIQTYHSSTTSTTSVSSKQTATQWNDSRQDTQEVTRDTQREPSTSDILLQSDEQSSTNVTLVAIFDAITTLQEILIPMSERLARVESLLTASSNQSVQSPASLQVPSTYQEKFSPSSQALLSPSNVFTDEATVFLGDPSLEVKVSRKALVRASVKAGRRNQLALNLLDLLFEQKTLAESTVNGTRDGSKKALDSTIIDAIKSHCFEKFPVTSAETPKEAMQRLTKSITDKCTSLAK
ncbi:uncharacterized protein LOC134195875 [Corticium candelabrum]|nr:uncharacterized protein LOC134195875 [Corticium candelabrum]XP_062520948.1 uncharacterized protein LOC134195875 [Corticium candelabrum]